MGQYVAAPSSAGGLGNGHLEGVYPMSEGCFRCAERIAEIARLKAENERLRGALAADDARSRAAADRAGVTFMGCDTAGHLADAVVELGADLAEARKLIDALADVDEVAGWGPWRDWARTLRGPKPTNRGNES